MFGIEIVPFKTEKEKSFFFKKRKIVMTLKEIEELLQKNDFLRKLNESAKKGQEEYLYIQKKPPINETNMRKIYDMISRTFNNQKELKMDSFYRKGEVYILNHQKHNMSNLMDFLDFDKGMPHQEVPSRMKELFSYIQEKEIDKNEEFIRSQIAHFYFVYIHPYYDGNGRSARVLSSWYLLNHKMNPYTIFLRGIELSKEEYLESIRKSRNGNITPFLEYMTKIVKKELQKEIIINNISSNQDLTEEEKDTLLLVLSTNHQTIDEVKRLYELKINHPDNNTIAEKIISLQEKGILEQRADGKLVIRQNDTIKRKEYRR